MVHVVIAEDDPFLRETVAEVLAEEGFGVETAPDGQAALAVIERIAPQVVVSDIAMPRVDGVQLALRVKQRYPTVPVILMSAAERDPRLKGVVFLPKPFDIEDLVVTVRRVVG